MIGDNYREVLEKIALTASQCGRNPSEITLVAVSKSYRVKDLVSVYNAGCRNFGESRIQEALEKIPGMPEGVRWHLIGTLQKNKVRKVLGKFALIHSIDTFDLAEKISSCSQEMGIVTPILLQVNTSGEMTKHGLNEEEWKKNIETILSFPSIRLEGLMTMAPLSEDEKVIRRCFSKLKQFQSVLQQLTGNPKLFTQLSMGMSHDYPIAIQEGATLLRIGRAIFEKKI